MEKTPINAHNTPERRFREAGDYLCKTRLNTSIRRHLGEGSQGHAYLLKNGKVLKVTGQHSEYHTSTTIIGLQSPYINRIYDTFLIKDLGDTFYGVLQEYLDTSCQSDLGDMEEYAYEEFNTDFWDLFRYVYHEDPLEFSEEYAQLISAMEYDGHKVYVDYMKDLLAILYEVDRLDIKSVDILDLNLGMKNGRLVQFDLGYTHTSREVKKQVEILTLK